MLTLTSIYIQFRSEYLSYIAVSRKPGQRNLALDPCWLLDVLTRKSTWGFLRLDWIAWLAMGCRQDGLAELGLVLRI